MYRGIQHVFLYQFLLLFDCLVYCDCRKYANFQFWPILTRKFVSDLNLKILLNHLLGLYIRLFTTQVDIKTLNEIQTDR